MCLNPADAADLACLNVDRLCKAFDNRPVLTDVTFSARPGDFVILRGKNGSGKSTLIKAIAGFITPDSGSVDYGAITPDEVSISCVPQVIRPPLYLTGRDVFLIAGAALGFARPAVVRRLGELAQILDLIQLDAPASFYSFGMLKKLALAVALIRVPHILLLDEALDGIDLATRERILGWLPGLCARGMVAVAAVHETQTYESVFNTIGSVKEVNLSTTTPVAPSPAELLRPAAARGANN